MILQNNDYDDLPITIVIHDNVDSNSYFIGDDII